MKNLTPEHMRCFSVSQCPSIHQLEDGRLLIVGERARGGDVSTVLLRIEKIL